MKKKILILGSSGMLGNMLFSYLTSLQKYDITDIARDRVNDMTYVLDVKYQSDELCDFILSNQYDYVINAIGILVKPAENNVENAIWINSYFPHLLESITKDTKTKVIHISTDCVFGSKGPYKPQDFHDGKDIYSKTKSLGEINNSKDLTIRTSIIGPEISQHKTGLLEWFLAQVGEIQGWVHAYWSGITTLELAKVIDKCIDANICGLYQLSPNYFISKFNLLRLIKEIWHKDDITVIPNEGEAHNKTFVCSEPSIPNYVMPSSYKEMLLELKQFMENK